ncbi:alpha/beta fold hydrolase [Trichothermofontia sp.]
MTVCVSLPPRDMALAPPPLGYQRDWVWRGWRIRYTFLRPVRFSPDAAPILFLHGFGAAIGQWRFNLQALAQTHPVYALDFLGFGASTKAATAYSVDLWATQVYEFWRIWLGQPVYLVGHSLGALVAVTAAVAQPEMVRSLALFTLPAARQEALPAWAIPMVGAIEGICASPLLLKPLFQVVRRPSFIRAGLRMAYHDPSRVDTALLDIYATPPRDRGASRAFCWLVRSSTQAAYSPRLRTLLPQLRCPTLLLWGDCDRVVPLTLAQQWLPLSSHLTLQTFSAAGHCLYDECPEAVNQVLSRWFVQG